MSETTRSQKHGARATLYAALAVPYFYPDEERFGVLRDPDVRTGVRSAADRLGLEGPAEEFLAASEGADLEELQATYNRLFGVPDDDGEYRVAPYEAQYTAGSEISHQQRRIATVVGLMEAFGVEPSETFTERQDHVAAELELMQVVAAKRALAYREGDPDAARDLRDAEATILAEHLVEFVPALAHDLQQATDDPVYRSAATFTQQLVEWDHASHPDAETVPTDPEGGEVTTDAR